MSDDSTESSNRPATCQHVFARAAIVERLSGSVAATACASRSKYDAIRRRRFTSTSVGCGFGSPLTRFSRPSLALDTPQHGASRDPPRDTTGRRGISSRSASSECRDRIYGLVDNPRHAPRTCRRASRARHTAVQRTQALTHSVRSFVRSFTFGAIVSPSSPSSRQRGTAIVATRPSFTFRV